MREKKMVIEWVIIALLASLNIVRLFVGVKVEVKQETTVNNRNENINQNNNLSIVGNKLRGETITNGITNGYIIIYPAIQSNYTVTNARIETVSNATNYTRILFSPK